MVFKCLNGLAVGTTVSRLRIPSCGWHRESTAAALGVDSGTHHPTIESVVQPSVAVLYRSRPRAFGTVYHQAWHHHRVSLFFRFAWKLSCSRGATVLTSLHLLSTCITHFIDCMLRALEVSWLYITLVAFVLLIIIIIIIILSVYADSRDRTETCPISINSPACSWHSSIYSGVALKSVSFPVIECYYLVFKFMLLIIYSSLY